MTKVLYSPGYGAGWSTWMSGSAAFNRWVLTYPPIIEALERREKLISDKYTYSEMENIEHLHPALQQFVREAKEKFDKKPYIGGASDLVIAEVTGAFRITEYDGAESLEQSYDDWINLDD